ELGHNTALTADFVMRRGVAFGGVFSQFAVDQNYYNAVRVLSVDPVTQVPTTVPARIIPACQGATTADTIALRHNPSANCSVGSLSVYQSAANSRYLAGEIMIDKRFARRFQVAGSYVYSHYTAWNDPVQDLYNWQSTYGLNANDRTHRLSLSGMWM